MDIPEYEQNLDELFCDAFSTNHPAMHDWVKVKFELKELRRKVAEFEREHIFRLDQ